ncbi:unnamed protein product [Ectocarpus sp. CCAP 1310/34]|nr:unnamed protein product [Ectocarpus sp. CCAP 1310/34]
MAMCPRNLVVSGCATCRVSACRSSRPFSLGTPISRLSSPSPTETPGIGPSGSSRGIYLSCRLQYDSSPRASSPRGHPAGAQLGAAAAC